MTTEKQSANEGVISEAVLDELMSGYEKPEDLLGDDGLFKELKRRLIEKALCAELTDHLGCEKNDPAGRGSGNSRNCHSTKRLKGEDGEREVAVPGDRNASFDPRIVRNGQRRIDGFDDKVISMYACGMSVREVRGHLRELYGVEVSLDPINRRTDAVLEEVRAWQNRALESVCPIAIFDALRVKIRDEGIVRNKAVCVALAVTRDGCRDVLGIWIENQEGARFWLKVMNELRSRGLADILIAVVDGLKGAEAINAAFPDAVIQTCIVHLVRHSLNFCSYKDRRIVAADFKNIYHAETADVAQARLAEFGRCWDERYSSIGQSWRRNWEKVVPFFAFHEDILRIIYTTNRMDMRLGPSCGRMAGARTASWRRAAPRLEAPPGCLIQALPVEASAHRSLGGRGRRAATNRS